MPRTLSQWFTTSAFAVPAVGQFGNAGRSLVSGPGINNWDLSFSKRTEVNERIALIPGAGTFGQVVSARNPRITQLGLRLVF